VPEKSRTGKSGGHWPETAFEEMRSQKVLRSSTFPPKQTSGSFRRIHIDKIDVASPNLAASFAGGATEKTLG
jgi:hypothetical protein